MYCKVIGFDCCLGIYIHGNPKALYGQDLAFRLSVKCKAPLQKKKKKNLAGFHFVFCALFLAAFIATVAKLPRTYAHWESVLLVEGIPFVAMVLC